jgi:serine/threonine protein kinase
VSAKTFGRYLLVELLAQGGMGQVFRAILRGGPGFEKQVALKRILKELCNDSEFVTRFGDEARIASTLSHGNIVQVFDFGEIDGEYYLTMEYIDGPDLGTLLEAAARQGERLPIPVALAVAADICRGLGAAHLRKDQSGRPQPVVHRDISPPNVLISRGGEVKVTDFGIAKAADKAMRTQTGMIMGKCRYMSPEQASGEKVDASTDTFAAGILLFEMLIGRPLFDGDTVEEVLHHVLLSPIPRLLDMRPDAPAELDTILARALDRTIDARYADGTQMARDLERLLHTSAPDYSRDDLVALIERLLPREPNSAQQKTRPVVISSEAKSSPRDVAMARTVTPEPIAAKPTTPADQVPTLVGEEPQNVGNADPADQTLEELTRQAAQGSPTQKRPEPIERIATDAATAVKDRTGEPDTKGKTRTRHGDLTPSAQRRAAPRPRSRTGPQSELEQAPRKSPQPVSERQPRVSGPSMPGKRGPSLAPRGTRSWHGPGQAHSTGPLQEPPFGQLAQKDEEHEHVYVSENAPTFTSSATEHVHAKDVTPGSRRMLGAIVLLIVSLLLGAMGGFAATRFLGPEKSHSAKLRVISSRISGGQGPKPRRLAVAVAVESASQAKPADFETAAKHIVLRVQGRRIAPSFWIAKGPSASGSGTLVFALSSAKTAARTLLFEPPGEPAQNVAVPSPTAAR